MNTAMHSVQEMSQNAVRDSIFCLKDSQDFGYASLWTHYYLFLDGSLHAAKLEEFLQGSLSKSFFFLN